MIIRIILIIILLILPNYSYSLINDVYGIYGDATPKNAPDSIYITYFQSGGGDFKFAKSSNIGVNWSTGFITQTGAVGEYSSSKVIDSETVAAIYFNNSDDTLYFIKTVNGSTSWSVPVNIDSGETAYFWSSIYALNASDIFISYLASSTIDLMYGKTADGGDNWTTGIVDSSIRGGTTTPSSIYAYDTDNLWISYYHTRAPINTQDLAVAKSINGGTNWTIDQIDTVGDVGIFSSLYGNSNTNLNISYLDITNLIIKFAKSINGGTDYTLSTLYSSGAACTGSINCTAISGVGTDNLYAVFSGVFGGFASALFAKSTDGGTNWTISQFEATSSRGFSITAFNTQHIFASYINSSNSLRAAVSNDGGDTWVIQTIEGVGATGCCTSIGAK